ALAHPARCGGGRLRPVRAQLDPPRRPAVPVLPRAVLEPLPLPDDDGLRRDGVAECRPRPRVVRTIHRLVLGLPLPVRDEPVLRASLFILPLVVGFGGNAYFFGANTSQGDYFRYFGKPSTNLWGDLQQTYGSDPSAWQWFNNHLQPGQRIASLEYRVYYIGAVLRVADTMLYLD